MPGVLLLQIANSNLFQYGLNYCCSLLVVKTRDNRTTVNKVENKDIKTQTELATNVEEFEMMKNYMFITTRTVSIVSDIFSRTELI